MEIKTTFGEILDSGHWDEFCKKHGYNPWMLNEGLATRDEQVTLSIEDAKLYGLLETE